MINRQWYVLIEIAVIMIGAGLLLWNLHAKPILATTRVWPLTLLILILAVAVIVTVHAAFDCRGKGAVSGGADSAHPVANVPIFDLPSRRFALMALFAGYCIALPYLGFAFASVAFMVVSAWLLDAPRRVAPFVCAAAGAFAIHYLFVGFFSVPLPRVLGVLGM